MNHFIKAMAYKNDRCKQPATAVLVNLSLLRCVAPNEENSNSVQLEFGNSEICFCNGSFQEWHNFLEANQESPIRSLEEWTKHHPIGK